MRAIDKRYPKRCVTRLHHGVTLSLGKLYWHPLASHLASWWSLWELWTRLDLSIPSLCISGSSGRGGGRGGGWGGGRGGRGGFGDRGRGGFGDRGRGRGGRGQSLRLINNNYKFWNLFQKESRMTWDSFRAKRIFIFFLHRLWAVCLLQYLLIWILCWLCWTNAADTLDIFACQQT